MGGETIADETQGVVPIVDTLPSPFPPRDARDFKGDTIVTAQNLPSFLEAAGFRDCFVIEGWVDSVASASGLASIHKAVRAKTAAQVCVALKDAGLRDMAQTLTAFLMRNSI